jgi:hypothetical protein
MPVYFKNILHPQIQQSVDSSFQSGYVDNEELPSDEQVVANDPLFSFSQRISSQFSLISPRFPEDIRIQSI